MPHYNRHQCGKFCHNHYEMQSWQCRPPYGLSLIARANWARNWAAELARNPRRERDNFPAYFKATARILLVRSKTRGPIPLP